MNEQLRFSTFDKQTLVSNRIDAKTRAIGLKGVAEARLILNSLQIPQNLAITDLD